MNAPLLDVKRLCVRYPVPGRLMMSAYAQAVARVDLRVSSGEIVGLVGESGSGKSTLARAILRLVPAHSGSITFQGQNLLALSSSAMRAARRHVQMIFQDPLSSLNPRMSVGANVAEPLRNLRPDMPIAKRRAAVAEMLCRVGLEPDTASRLPRQFSGGQCQRLAIARAAILGPALLVCDEPVSALDVSIRGQIMNLLKDLQSAQGCAMLFITHDLALVRRFAQRIYVMHRGRIVESATAHELFANPQHEFTRSLLRGSPADPQSP